MFVPRDYQELFLQDALAFIASATPGGKKLYSSPTGTGKSMMELYLSAHRPMSLIMTPRNEIIEGMLNKLGVQTYDLSMDSFRDTALAHRIVTPITLRNMLAKGTLPFKPTEFICDEAHHAKADSYEDIAAYCPSTIWLGLTATPFRGTPKSTDEFHKQWGGNVTQILNIKQAAERDLFTVPEVTIWPLVDDDTITISNGDIQAIAAAEAIKPRLSDLVDQCKGFVTSTLWDKSTIFAVPTTDTVNDLVDRLNNAGLPAVGITQITTRKERNESFDSCIDKRVAIVQINVVSEGVDFPFRRLIDIRPTYSPVFWLQMVGRITRPGAGSEYIVCCRNLERHAYLMEGLIPPSKIGEAQQAFPEKTRRPAPRAIGIEGLGKFKPADLPAADGSVGQMFTLYKMDQFKKIEYAILLHACVAEPLYASREHIKNPDGTTAYGRWKRIMIIPSDFEGYQSASPSEISDKQRHRWLQTANYVGLDREAKVTKKNFAALFVLLDTRNKLKIGGW